MKKKAINITLVKSFRIRKKYIIGILLALLIESGISLGLPGILSKIIDGLGNESVKWLISFVFVFLGLVIIKGLATIINSLLSETMGRSICDEIRCEMFKKLLGFSVAQHKNTRTGEFFERIEGDINILVGFFSNMLIDIISSSLMVLGILVVFITKSLLLGGIFFVISIMIFALFIGSQKRISRLWNDARVRETNLFGSFSETMYASLDINGLSKEEYAISRFQKAFSDFESKQVKASFWGNVPATIFFSLLNIGEGIALIIGVNLLSKNMLTMGEVYLLISYVGLLNMPFFHLKYQFTQMPMAISAFERVNAIFEMNSEKRLNKEENSFSGNEIEFVNVSFGYDNSDVISNTYFVINANENVLIEGRTGNGKTTILQLLAGLYEPNEGIIKIGGKDINSIQREDYLKNVFYITQFYPIVEDTLKNNLLRFSNIDDEEKITSALKKTHMDVWMQKRGKELEDVIMTDDFSPNSLQMMAWTAAIIASPKILLVDEFDASIDNSILAMIDELMITEFVNTTIIMISHKNRSSLKFQKIIHVRETDIFVESVK